MTQEPASPDRSAARYPNIGQALLLLPVYLWVTFAALMIVAVIDLLAESRLAQSAALLAVVQTWSYGVVLWFALQKVGRPVREVFALAPFRPSLLLPLIPLLLGLGIVTSEIDNITRWYFPVPSFIDQIMGEVLGRGVMSVLLLLLVAPVAEELLFRGVILRGFLTRYAVPYAVVGSAAVFALFHLNPYQFVTAFSAGVLLGWLFQHTASLPLCIVAHALYNTHVVAAANLPILLNVHIPGYTVRGIFLPDAVEFQPLWFDGLGVLLMVGALLILRKRLGARAVEVIR